MRKVRECLWVSGQEAGCYHTCNNNMWKLPGASRMTPAEDALYFGVPNIMIVRFANEPKPPFREYAIPLKLLKQVVWSIIAALTASPISILRQPNTQEIGLLGLVTRK